MQELEFLRLASVPQLSSPLIPLDKLKQFMMKALMDAVNNGAGHIRDPIGGSCTHRSPSASNLHMFLLISNCDCVY